jgi:hypothetical protein
MHATKEELQEWMGSEAPQNAERLLQRASNLIDSVVVAPYAKRADGTIIDVNVSNALRDAVSAQVEWWLQTGDVTEASARFASSGKGISVKSTGRRLAPQAEDVLFTGGLLNRGIGVS